jgi:hypothetical protein
MTSATATSLRPGIDSQPGRLDELFEDIALIEMIISDLLGSSSAARCNDSFGTSQSQVGEGVTAPQEDGSRAFSFLWGSREARRWSRCGTHWH